MSGERYFICSRDNIDDSVICLRGPEAHHLSRVVRARKGDTVNLMDGEGTVVKAMISGIDESSVYLDPVSRKTIERPFSVDLAVALIKSGRLDQVVEKSSELGVRRIIPVICDRTVWRGGTKEAEKKKERLQRKAISACKQSGQPYFPVIEKVTRFKELVDLMPEFLRVYLADSEGDRITLFPRVENDKGVLGIVGPEGGFTEEEQALILSSGAIQTTLGPFRLRAETAAICLAYGLLSSYR
ncbi:MAG: 16S rRNA (uracil(1498)-N(3))-methyltransferase [Candidatus Krumholzibacteriota bacterium]|nr:16S rRNA (uracil(1498)-N(3))-methyltransferase [Candidatus Krumholzibacteriota bacterium]